MALGHEVFTLPADRVWPRLSTPISTLTSVLLCRKNVNSIDFFNHSEVWKCATNTDDMSINILYTAREIMAKLPTVCLSFCLAF